MYLAERNVSSLHEEPLAYITYMHVCMKVSVDYITTYTPAQLNGQEMTNINSLSINFYAVISFAYVV